jgi:hypothetical protein
VLERQSSMAFFAVHETDKYGINAFCVSGTQLNEGISRYFCVMPSSIRSNTLSAFVTSNAILSFFKETPVKKLNLRLPDYPLFYVVFCSFPFYIARPRLVLRVSC